MAVLRLVDVAVDIGKRRLFGAVGASVDAGDRVALVGPNGAGKSTLLAVAAGVRPATQGAVVRAQGARVGYLAQEADLPEGATVWDVGLRAGTGEIPRLEARLRALEPRLADEPELLDLYGEALERFEHLGGYGWEARVREHLAGVGLSPDSFALAPAALSGGQRVRLALATILLVDPDLLLLDEPTNHLDLGAIHWLEETLARYRGALVFVSHDRAFLRRLATATWSLDEQGFTPLPLGYEAHRAALARRRAEMDARYAQAQVERERLAAFVRKWSAGTRARQARDRERKLERIAVERPPLRRGRLRLRFATAAGRRQRGLVVEAAAMGFGGRTLWRDLDLVLEQGARLGVVGPNGSGKSTLLRVLASDLAPRAGRVAWSDDTRIGVLRQDVDVPGESVLDAILRLSGMTRFEAHRRLGEGLFAPDQLATPVEALSGGERTRLGLVALTAGGSNVLLLDEPTNHLDVDAQEALEEALQAFEGTIIVASHDRAFLAATTERWLVLEPGGTPRLTRDRERLLAGPANALSGPGAPGAAAAAPARYARPRRPTAAASARALETVEAEIVRAEEARAALEALFAAPYSPEQAARRSEYERLLAELEAAYERWDALAAEAEEAGGAGAADER